MRQMAAVRGLAVMALSLSLAGRILAAEIPEFTNWPKDMSPQAVGKRVSEHFVPVEHQYTPTIHYSEICTWYGAMTFAQLTKDTDLRDRLIKKFEPLQVGGTEAA